MKKTQWETEVAVIGAGFGGLGAALSLSERGRSVCLFETLNYPGGCASTFQREGFRFESGATLFSGFSPNQLFGRWISRYQLDVEIDWLDPVVELRTPELHLPVGRERGDFARRLCALPGAPRERLERFFRYQKEIADILWEVLDSPDLLPPLDFRCLWRHGTRAARYLPFLRLVGRPLVHVLERFGLKDFQPLRIALDALCQITVQCGLEEAEAPFALSCMDYYYRGTGHVRGGIGVLSHELVRAIQTQGGDVRYATRVKSIVREGERWRLETRRGTCIAKAVVANLLPQDLGRLLGSLPPSLKAPLRRVESGWGACMLYRVVRAPAEESDEPHHLEMVQDPGQKMTEGNHIFASISGKDDPGRVPEAIPEHDRLRTMSVSTHIPLSELATLSEEEQGRRVEEVQQRMRRGLEDLAPEWSDTVYELPASPRTFERFTGRHLGYVGGNPRRSGIGHYLKLGPLQVRPGLWMVGDTVFPGQSTLATATGGLCVAKAVDRTLS